MENTVFEFLEYITPGWGYWKAFKDSRKRNVEKAESIKRAVEMARFGVLLEMGYVPFRYRFFGIEEGKQREAVLSDVLERVPFSEIFSREIAQGFTEERQKIMDEAESIFREAYALLLK